MQWLCGLSTQTHAKGASLSIPRAWPALRNAEEIYSSTEARKDFWACRRIGRIRRRSVTVESEVNFAFAAVVGQPCDDA